MTRLCVNCNMKTGNFKTPQIEGFLCKTCLDMHFNGEIEPGVQKKCEICNLDKGLRKYDDKCEYCYMNSKGIKFPIASQLRHLQTVDPIPLPSNANERMDTLYTKQCKDGSTILLRAVTKYSLCEVCICRRQYIHKEDEGNLCKYCQFDKELIEEQKL